MEKRSSLLFVDRRSVEKFFWDIPVLNDVCWDRKKILMCIDLVMKHIVIRIGDGRSTSVWFDNWSFLSPLCQYISNRDIFKAGLSLSCKIAYMVCEGERLCPECWREKFEFLFHLPPPILFHDRLQKALWKYRNEKVYPFSVKIVRTDLSVLKPIVPWYKDKVAVWNRVDLLKCPLCNSIMDDHDHLFFGCVFSSRVWIFFKGLIRFESAPDNLYSIIDYISSRPICKSIWSIIQRLVLGASMYHLWIERNKIILQGKSRNVDDICSMIKDLVRLRILGLKIKGSKQAVDAAKIWDFQVMRGNKGKVSN
ncbi:hypothetical protein Tco_0755715 [Tanacetum coccineum]